MKGGENMGNYTREIRIPLEIVYTPVEKEEKRSEHMALLLMDHGTEKNIVWATNNYRRADDSRKDSDEILLTDISDIKPRLQKSKEEQKLRTKERAEVFTPSWICNRMINEYDNMWFGRKKVFNVEHPKNHLTWISRPGKVSFPTADGKTWQDYVLSTRIEMTCGEAPYLVSIYDTTTGNKIDVPARIGMLDRKLRVISENTSSEEEWLNWVYKAYESTYGYEFQGDNLFLARKNLFQTFVEYLDFYWHREYSPIEAYKICEIISWNIFQMDGLTFEIPFSQDPTDPSKKLFAKIKNWRNELFFKDITK